MGKFLDMTGWVMNEHGVPESRLTVISRAEDHISEAGNHSTMWNCVCECGEFCVAYGQSLRRGTTLSCGCYNSEMSHKRFFQDLTGQKFGRLTVVDRASDYVSPSGETEVRWNCDCHCGNRCIVNSDNLKNGSTQSCGCFRLERILETHKKQNVFEQKDGYYIGYYQNYDDVFYFDNEDYDFVTEHYWYRDENGYARTYIDNKYLSMHELLGCKWHDHINRNGSDNRRSNLRPCSRAQNQRNRNKQINNTSGIIGVYWHKQNQAWVANISLNSKTVYLGGSPNKEEAIRLRLQAEAEHYKEFAPQIHLFEQYNIKIPQEVKE